MKPKVGIGLTTYLDIRSPEFGSALYKALASTASDLAPTQVRVINERYDVSCADEFAAHWHNDRLLVANPKYGAPTPPIWAEIGLSWRTKGRVSGDASVQFCADPNDAHTMSVSCSYIPGIDWRRLLQQLTGIFSPAHAMLHIFTADEISRAGHGRFAFVQPVVGENSFICWRSNLGMWRRPDAWDVTERRRYRFLPNMAWANHLGREFMGTYDRDALLASAPFALGVGEEIYFQVTSDIRDVVKDFEKFDAARMSLRNLFSDGVFREVEEEAGDAV